MSKQGTIHKSDHQIWVGILDEKKLRHIASDEVFTDLSRLLYVS